MNTELWEAIQGVKVSDEKAVEDFIELTAPGFSRAYPDEEDLSQVYLHIRGRLSQLTKKDDFWEWSSRQFPLLSSTGSVEVRPEIIAELTTLLLDSTQGKRHRWNLLDLLAKLTLNFFLLSLVWIWALDFLGPGFRKFRIDEVLVVGGTALGNTLRFFASYLLPPLLLSLFMSPWFGWWRKRFFRLPTAVSALFTSVVCVLGTVCVFGCLELFLGVFCDSSSSSELCEELRWHWGSLAERAYEQRFPEALISDSISKRWDIERLLFPFVTCFVIHWVILSLSKRRAWIMDRSDSWWRKAFSSLLLLPFVLSAFGG